MQRSAIFCQTTMEVLNVLNTYLNGWKSILKGMVFGIPDVFSKNFSHYIHAHHRSCKKHSWKEGRQRKSLILPQIYLYVTSLTVNFKTEWQKNEKQDGKFNGAWKDWCETRLRRNESSPFLITTSPTRASLSHVFPKSTNELLLALGLKCRPQSPSTFGLSSSVRVISETFVIPEMFQASLVFHSLWDGQTSWGRNVQCQLSGKDNLGCLNTMWSLKCFLSDTMDIKQKNKNVNTKGTMASSTTTVCFKYKGGRQQIVVALQAPLATIRQ